MRVSSGRSPVAARDRWPRRRPGARPVGLSVGRRGLWVPGGVFTVAGAISGMFVADEVLLDLSLGAAAARLTEMARGGLLTPVSQGAYGDGLTGLARVGPLGMSMLVEVHLLDVAVRGESAVLPLRWQATGPGSRLFPALDADLALTPVGEHAIRLSLAGAYRPPLGPVAADGGRVDASEPGRPPGAGGGVVRARRPQRRPRRQQRPGHPRYRAAGGGRPKGSGRPRAAAAFDIVVRFIKTALRTLLVVGLIVAVGALLTGPPATGV
jgi:hypothetical protein